LATEALAMAASRFIHPPHKIILMRILMSLITLFRPEMPVGRDYLPELPLTGRGLE
jgi:hypothetical protein